MCIYIYINITCIKYFNTINILVEEYEENSDFIAYLNKLGGFKVEQFCK